MENSHERDGIKILKDHEKLNVKFLKATELNANAIIIQENLSFSDFKQGDTGNCGLVAAISTLPKRSEFLTEIAPKIERL